MASASHADVTLALRGHGSKSVTGRVLTGPSINAANDFGKSSVQPTALNARVTQAGVSVSLPSRSVSVLTIE